MDIFKLNNFTGYFLTLNSKTIIAFIFNKMGKETVSDLVKFMLPYPDHVKAAALSLREFVWNLYPETNELIYDNYNAVAFGWSPTDKAGDVFCSIALYSEYLNFGFLRGTDFPDPEKKLSGNGNRYRYIQVKYREDFPEEYMKQLLGYAYENSISRQKPAKKIIKGQTIVKSVSGGEKEAGIKTKIDS